MAPPIIVSAQSTSPSSSRRALTKSSIVSSETLPGNRSFAENVRASLGVAVDMSASSCMTYAIFRLNSTGLISLPATLTLPLILTSSEGAERPASTLRREVLPAPEYIYSSVKKMKKMKKMEEGIIIKIINNNNIYYILYIYKIIDVN
jgi:hypothetical protein